MTETELCSFNPCFSGCRSATLRTFASAADVVGFNPCFSGCRSATLRNVLRGDYDDVSILVLVDAALRRYRPSLMHTAKSCFNPCFSGCRSATSVQMSCRGSIAKGVSILVLVDAALRLYRGFP